MDLVSKFKTPISHLKLSLAAMFYILLFLLPHHFAGGLGTMNIVIVSFLITLLVTIHHISFFVRLVETNSAAL